jgi:DedD protein
MHRGIGGTVFEPADERVDRELTLGPMTLGLLGILFFGICALCFVWGYSIGHRAPAGIEPSQPASAGPSAAQILSNQPKPGASDNSQQPRAEAPAISAPSGSSDAGSPQAVPAAVSTSTPASSGTGSLPTGGAVVQAILPSPAGPMPSNNGTVKAALGSNPPWMVQIAAVSQSEDADVLLSALRKRGYAVAAHRDPADNLIHVQVGPFSSHADAASMRQRLLNDGYNAMIEP